jgi:hypothetical protein
VPALVAYCLLVTVVVMRHRWLPAVVAWTAGAAVTVTAFAVVGAVPAGGPTNGVVLLSVSAVLGGLVRLWSRHAGQAAEAERLTAEEAHRHQDLEYREPGIVPAVQQELRDGVPTAPVP